MFSLSKANGNQLMNKRQQVTAHKPHGWFFIAGTFRLEKTLS